MVKQKFSRKNRSLNLSSETLEPRIVLDSTVVFNEIMYQPFGNDETLEYVELHNQQAVDMDLSGWKINGGVDFDFPEGTTIPGGGYLVVAKDPAALELATGITDTLGPFTGSLSNGGEKLELLNNIDSFVTRNSAGVIEPDTYWSLDIQGVGGVITNPTPPTMSGVEANSGIGNVWNPIDINGHTGVSVNPVFNNLLDNEGAATGVGFSITGTVSAWSNTPNDDLINDYLFVNAGNAATTATWEVSGLTPNTTYEIYAYGGVARDMALTVDTDGDGNLGNNSATLVAGSGFLFEDITSSVTGTISGMIGPGNSGEANWGGFHLIEGKLVDENNNILPGTVISGNAGRRVMDSVTYADNDPWPIAADGSGSSLTKINEDTGSAIPQNWTFSPQVGGTPGEANFFVPGPVVTNEVLDTSGNDTHGTPVAVTLTSGDGGFQGEAGLFNGGSSYVQVPIDLNPGIRPQVTIGAWVKAANINNPARHEIISTDNGGFDRAITIDSRIGGGETGVARYGAFGGTATGLVTGQNALISDGWVFVSAVFDNTANTTTLYVDNQTPVVGTATHNASQNFLRIGSHPTGVEPFSGLIDNAFIFDGALSALQIADIRTGGAAAIKAVAGPTLLGLYEFEPTAPGGGNQNIDTPDLAINEVASSNDATFEIELYNYGSDPIDLENIVIASSDTLATDFVFPVQTLPAGAYLTLDQTDLGFSAADNDRLYLYTAGKAATIDAARVDDSAQARSPDGTGRWLVPNASSFGSTNTFSIEDSIVINEILYNAYPDRGTADIPGTFSTTTLLDFDDAWRYNQNLSNAGLAQGWATAAHVVDNVDWLAGDGLLGFEPDGTAAPINTGLNAPQTNATFVTTYYFETEFNFTGVAGDFDLILNHVVDDGAVFYLNGQELHRFRLPAGIIDPSTLAPPAIDSSITTFVVPKDDLIVGTNRLSVEVHQATLTSSDILFGTEVLIRQELTPTIPGTGYQDNPEEWIELFNRSATETIDLTGWSLGGGIQYDFAPSTTIAPGEYLVIAKNSLALQTKYPAIASIIVGDFSGKLSNGGELIQLLDAVGNPTDEVHYFDGGRWSDKADGGGSSLELIDPNSDNSIAEAWAGSDEATDSSWQTYTYRGVATDDGIGNIGHYHEFVLGLLAAGEILLDDISVIEDPDGVATQLMQNGSFEADALGAIPAAWRLMGTHGDHGQSVVVVDPTNPANKALKLVTTGPTEDKHNQASTTYGGGETLNVGTEYEISFRAKWISGSNQVNTRLYFNYLQATTLIDTQDTYGTPGAANSQLVANAGPTYENFQHGPVVPAATEQVTVSVNAADPDGILVVDLFYSVNEGSFNQLAMTDQGGGVYSGNIPPQAATSIVQFYVRGIDSSGNMSNFPAQGSDAPALYKVQDNLASLGQLHNLRIIMTASDTNFMYSDVNRMSNDRLNATVIYDETEVFYNVGVRLKGSAFGRNNDGVAGLSIEFQPDQLFRDVHRTLSLERSGNPKELLAKHMLNRAAGGIASFYDDVGFVITPRANETGIRLFAMARTSDVYLESLYGSDGSSTPVYNQELLYTPNGTIDGNPESPKDNFPYNHTNGQIDITDLGDDKETYRWNYQIRNARGEDDFGPMIQLGQALSLTGQALEDAVAQIMDVDQWMRTFAMMSINGNDDFYTRVWRHNFRMIVDPNDGLIDAVPWDLDRAFQLGTTSAPFGTDGNLIKVFNRPIYNRLFWGHVLDVANTTANGEYLDQWAAHLGSLAGSSFADEVAYVEARVAFLLSQMPTEVAFDITTNGGVDFSVNESFATLEGEGWVNVRNIRLAGSTDSLAVTWLDADSWQLSVPLAVGNNAIQLEAFDHQGNLIGSDTINIESTVTNPVVDFLRITEIMYHPADPTAAEALAGFTDDDDFEFIEFQNISTGGSATTIDLSNVTLSNAIDFTFPAATMLAAGDRILVVRNQAAFTERYGSGFTIAGEYKDAVSSKLNNSGDDIVLQDSNGLDILNFRYEDKTFEGWYDETDGNGNSLVLIDATADPSTWGDPLSWRPSLELGGSPGSADKILADFNDDGKVGLADLLFLKKNFGTGTTLATGDLTGDGAVTAADLAVLLQNYGRTYQVDSIGSAPTASPAGAAASLSVNISAVDQAVTDTPIHTPIHTPTGRPTRITFETERASSKPTAKVLKAKPLRPTRALDAQQEPQIVGHFHNHTDSTTSYRQTHRSRSVRNRLKTEATDHILATF